MNPKRVKKIQMWGLFTKSGHLFSHEMNKKGRPFIFMDKKKAEWWVDRNQREKVRPVTITYSISATKKRPNNK